MISESDLGWCGGEGAERDGGDGDGVGVSDKIALLAFLIKEEVKLRSCIASRARTVSETEILRRKRIGKPSNRCCE